EDPIRQILNRKRRIGGNRHPGAQSGIVGGIHGITSRKPSQLFQILARLVETAAAERENVLPRRRYFFSRGGVILPAQSVVVKAKVAGVFVLDDRQELFFAQAQSMSQNPGDEDVDEAVHLGLNFGTEMPDRMVQAGGEFD